MKLLKLMFILLLVNVNAVDDFDFRVGRDQVRHHAEHLSEDTFFILSGLSNTTHLREAINNILVPRVVGSEGHKLVRDYIVNSLRDMQWSVELHAFHDNVPFLGRLQFKNIVATLNPQAERYLVLACHYDSKYMPDIEFLGATDSAVPCGMLLNLANVLQSQLENARTSKLSLMLIFFDGEEAFDKWSAQDSIYGSRHLAKKWESEGFLNKIDILILLDLIGAPDPNFYSYFRNTESWYSRFLTIEERLSDAGLMERYVSSGVARHSPNRYFQPNALRSSQIEDDHTPFLKRNVPILHLIPLPFPSVWHTKEDNASIIDYSTTENIARIVRVFTMEYLLGYIDNDNLAKTLK